MKRKFESYVNTSPFDYLLLLLQSSNRDLMEKCWNINDASVRLFVCHTLIPGWAEWNPSCHKSYPNWWAIQAQHLQIWQKIPLRIKAIALIFAQLARIRKWKQRCLYQPPPQPKHGPFALSSHNSITILSTCLQKRNEITRDRLMNNYMHETPRPSCTFNVLVDRTDSLLSNVSYTEKTFWTLDSTFCFLV